MPLKQHSLNIHIMPFTDTMTQLVLYALPACSMPSVSLVPRSFNSLVPRWVLRPGQIQDVLTQNHTHTKIKIASAEQAVSCALRSCGARLVHFNHRVSDFHWLLLEFEVISVYFSKKMFSNLYGISARLVYAFGMIILFVLLVLIDINAVNFMKSVHIKFRRFIFNNNPKLNLEVQKVYLQQQSKIKPRRI